MSKSYGFIIHNKRGLGQKQCQASMLYAYANVTNTHTDDVVCCYHNIMHILVYSEQRKVTYTYITIDQKPPTWISTYHMGKNTRKSKFYNLTYTKSTKFVILYR